MTTSKSQNKGSKKKHSARKMVMLEDDKWFCKVAKGFAKKMNIELLTFTNVEDFLSYAAKEKFDIAIIDYYLDEHRGPTVATVIEDLPVLLMSHRDVIHLETDYWPMSVKGFISKEEGIKNIFKTATSLAA